MPHGVFRFPLQISCICLGPIPSFCFQTMLYSKVLLRRTVPPGWAWNHTKWDPRSLPWSLAEWNNSHPSIFWASFWQHSLRGEARGWVTQPAQSAGRLVSIGALLQFAEWSLLRKPRRELPFWLRQFFNVFSSCEYLLPVPFSFLFGLLIHTDDKIQLFV